MRLSAKLNVQWHLRTAQCRVFRRISIRACMPPCSQIQSDLTLEAANGWKIQVLGASHMQHQAHIGKYILDRKPAAVLTETSLTPEQGAVPGGTVSCSSQVQGPAAFWVRMFCAVGAELEKQGAAAFEPGGVWHGLQQNYHGEQLAYIAAFALNKPLVFVDRPKDITYRRMWALPTIIELDEAFTSQAVENYRGILRLCGAEPHKSGQRQGGQNIVEKILLQEREAIMCHVMESWCSRLQLEDSAAEPKEIVAVLGAAHLPGVQALWQSGEWRALVGSHDIEKSPLMGSPHPPALSGHDMAVKRGLLESTFRLSVPEMVIGNMGSILGAVPQDLGPVYMAVRQIYGSTRMLLATLPQDMLPQVCGGFECDMWSLLQRLRAVRPINGGPGYAWDVLEELQMLYLEIEGEEEDEEKEADGRQELATNQ